MIVHPNDVVSNVTDSCDVCIIGSGSSGGVMAMEMARAGYSVIVLEEGGFYKGASLNQREADMMGELYQQRGARATKDVSVSIMQGKCVGGGTVVNVADCVRIHDPVLRRWEKEFGITDMTPEIMSPYFEKAEKIIKVNKIRGEDLSKNSLLFKKGIEALGYSGDTFHHNTVGCKQCGYCLLGCTYNAKQAVSLNYIPMALESGAKLYVYARAERVLEKAGRAHKVTGVILNPKTKKPKVEIEITAQVIMVAANTINTDQLLLNSGIANSSGLIGKNLILQPQTMVAGLFSEELKSHRGITQSYFCDEFEEADEERGLTGFRLESAFGLPGLVANIMPGFGMKTKELMTRYNYMTGMMILVPEEPSGEVKINKYGRPVIHHYMRDDTKRRMMQGMKEGAKVMFAAGAEKVIFVYEVPTIIDDSSRVSIVDEKGIEPAKQAIMAFHIQGTCRMGPDPKTSVVDNYMESHDVKNLFVVDASVCPTTSSSHNMVAVMAMAHRAADYILTNRGRYLG
jgi:choline dehydrogenase-like flavoprotein